MTHKLVTKCSAELARAFSVCSLILLRKKLFISLNEFGIESLLLSQYCQNVIVIKFHPKQGRKEKRKCNQKEEENKGRSPLIGMKLNEKHIFY